MSIMVLKSRIRGWTAGMRGVLEIGSGDGRWSADVGCPWYGVDCAYPLDGLPSELRGRVTIADAKAVESWKSLAPDCDCAMMIDVIEHMKKDEGLRILDSIEKQFKRIIIFTPLGWFPINYGDGHPLTHKSAWFPEDFASRGYLVEVWPVFHAQGDGSVYGAIFATKECG
jgi:hypothetical protein